MSYTPGVTASPTSQILAFSPLQNGGCKLWIDPTDYANLSLSGSSLSSVVDKSSYANNANQSGGTKPTWSQTGFNGLAAGVSNAGNQTDLVVISSSSIDNIFAGGGTITRTFILTGSGSNQTLFCKSPDAPNVATSGYKVLFYGSGTSLTLRFFAGGSTSRGVWDSTTAVVNLNTPYVIDVSYNSSSPSTAPNIYLNGIKVAFSVVTTYSGTYVSDAGANLILDNGADGGAEPLLGISSQTTMHNITQSNAFLTRLRAFLGGLSAIPVAPVYLMHGQSNMVGNAVAQPTTVYSYTPPNSPSNNPLIWNGNIFDVLAPAKNNLGVDSNSFGPELSFAQQKSAMQCRSTFIVKYALGATSLAVDWAPGTGTQWTNMVSTINAALPYLAKQGMIPVIESFLWTQGETDAQNQTYANAYQTNLTNFIAAVTSTALASYILSPDYTFVLSGLPNQDPVAIPYQGIVRQAQITVGTNGSNGYINTLDLALNVDQIHFNAQSQITLGERFAAIVPNTFPMYAGSYSRFFPISGPSIKYTTGPTTSTTNAIVTWGNNFGTVIQNSIPTIDTSGNITANSFKQSSGTASVLKSTQANTGYGANGGCAISIQNTNSGNSAAIQFYNGSQDSYIGQVANSALAFGGTTECMRLFFSSSALTINGTGDDGVNKLQVNGAISCSSAIMIATKTSFTNGAGSSAGTLTNAPAIGNPTKWIPVNDNGTTRYIPAW